MSTPRRNFIKTSLAVSAAAVLPSSALSAAAAATSGKREFYELRAYRMKTGASDASLHTYLEKAFIPACNRQGSANVGVFTENAPKDGPTVWMLIPHASLNGLVATQSLIESDPALKQAGTAYLLTPKATPAFDRIDSWLLHAFTGMPVMELPSYSKARLPRLFELRMYESYSEVKALKKIAMFNDGEIDVMRDVALAPVFFGQALTGPNLPHLTYMTSAPDADAHKRHWDAFKVHPTWEKLKNDPLYADTVSKNTARILSPTAYSQI